jgi:L-seryl-tRNA(Ser) seleniumtransferase
VSSGLSKDFSACIPSVERLLSSRRAVELIVEFGRPVVKTAVCNVLAELRRQLASADTSIAVAEHEIIGRVSSRLEDQSRSSFRRVFNLTGTVIHTNLGRATLPISAVNAITVAAQYPITLEYDLREGRRGDRDVHIEEQLCRLTGADAATIVNNNAAAVLLVLNSLARGKVVPVSRGELIEIGGSFRMPDIMKSSGCRLCEVGTTNRTHLHDYEEAIGPMTGAVMKVHTSNYAIEGFTAGVIEQELACLCHDRGVPFIIDLGSGTLIDLRKFGLPHEPTPMEALKHGADVVTFSGDKLLGGPQAGIIVGRADLIKKIKRNPIRRALRVDKMTVAALSAVLKLYLDPDRLTERLPTLRMLARSIEEIRNIAKRLYPIMVAQLDGVADVETVSCDSQFGSGALPTQRIASVGFGIKPRNRRAGSMLIRLAAAFRALPIPVIGRIQNATLLLDLRCLDDDLAFANQLSQLVLPTKQAK